MSLRLCRILVASGFALCLVAAEAQKSEPYLNPDGPDLVAETSAPGGPVVRFPVAHGHSTTSCFGYLYFSRDKVRYEELSPTKDKWHEFEWPRKELQKAEQWRMGVNLFGIVSMKPVATNAVELKFEAALYHFTRLKRAAMMAGNASDMPSSGVNEILEAANSFETVAARLQAQLDATKPPPIISPSVTINEPAGATAGSSLIWPTLGPVPLRGIVQHPSGIAWVHVNNTVLALTPLSPQIAEFKLEDLRTAAPNERVALIARAMSGEEVQVNVQVAFPKVVISEPVPGSTVNEDTVRVRGSISGIPSIMSASIASVPATMTQRADGSMEFAADGVPLPVGSSELVAEFVTPGGTQHYMVDVKHPKPAGPPPLTLPEVEDLLKNGVPTARVTTLVRQYGVTFRVDDEAERRLRAAGADSDLLLVITRSKK